MFVYESEGIFLLPLGVPAPCAHRLEFQTHIVIHLLPLNPYRLPTHAWRSSLPPPVCACTSVLIAAFTCSGNPGQRPITRTRSGSRMGLGASSAPEFALASNEIGVFDSASGGCSIPSSPISRAPLPGRPFFLERGEHHFRTICGSQPKHIGVPGYNDGYRRRWRHGSLCG
jgi:hypothetical protein